MTLWRGGENQRGAKRQRKQRASCHPHIANKLSTRRFALFLSRDVDEFQPHVALSYWENSECSGGWDYELASSRTKLAKALLDPSSPLTNRPVLSVYSLSGVGVSSWTRLTSVDLSMNPEHKGEFKTLNNKHGFPLRLQAGAAGVGAFASVFIPGGAFLGVYEGRLKSNEDEDGYDDMNNGRYVFSLPCPFVLDAGDCERSNWTRYMNHSPSSPNVVARIKRVDKRALEAGTWEEEETVIDSSGNFYAFPKHDPDFCGDLGWVDTPGTSTSLRVEFYTMEEGVGKEDELRFDYGEEFKGEWDA